MAEKREDTVKILLLLAAVIVNDVSYKPPANPETGDKRLHNACERGGAVFMANAARASVWLVCMAHIAAIYALRTSSGSNVLLDFTQICPYPSSNPNDLLSLSLTFVAGISLVLVSGLVRMWCFRTLGSLFTFVVTIKDKHILVTSGPYAYVRHPGYTALILLMTGTAIAFFSPGSYIAECGLLLTHVRWIVAAWCLAAIWSTFVALPGRGRIEDQMLKQKFGEEWEEYRRKVPRMFLPGIF